MAVTKLVIVPATASSFGREIESCPQAHSCSRKIDGTIYLAAITSPSGQQFVNVYKVDSELDTATLEVSYGPYITPVSINVIADGNGVIHLSWILNSGFGNGLYYAKKLSGAWDGAPTQIANSSSISAGGGTFNTYQMSMAIDTNSVVHVVAIDNANKGVNYMGGNMYYWTNLSGSFVRSTIDTDGANGWATSCAMAIDDQDVLHLFFTHLDNSPTIAQWRYATTVAGVPFSELNGTDPNNYEVIDQYTFFPTTDPSVVSVSIAIDSERTPHIVYKKWQSISGDTSNGVTGAWIYIKKNSTISPWADKEIVVAQQGLPVALRVRGPSVSVTKNGDVFIGGPRDNLNPLFPGQFVDNVLKRLGFNSFAPDYIGEDINRPREGVRLMHEQSPKNPPSAGILKNGWMGTYTDINGTSSVHYLIYSDDFEPDDGADLTDEGPPAYAAETNFPSIPFSNEGFPVAIYPFKVEFVYPYTDRFQTELETTDSEYDIAWPTVSKNRRQFVVRHNAMTTAEVAQLDAFLETVSGPLLTFWLSIPDPSESIKVKLVKEAVPKRKEADGVFETDFLVQESF